MKNVRIAISISLILICFLLAGCMDNIKLIAGGYTREGEKGIGVFDFNSGNGTLRLLSTTDAGPDPSYLCVSEENKMIYAINEVSEVNGTKSGGLTTLKFEGNFENIIKVNEMPIPDGGPCFISLTPDNTFLLIANYGGGSVAVVKLDKNGIPEKVSDTIFYDRIGSKIPRAHMISSDPKGKFIYVTDLGLDRIMIYKIEKTSGILNSLYENGFALPEGTGPRHFVFNRTGTKMYVIGERNSTVSVLSVSKKGDLRSEQIISTLEKDFAGLNYCADLHIGKSGKFLYGSNRGGNSIVTFSIGEDGGLALAGHTNCGGDWPRSFVIDPSGKYIIVGNQKSGNISILKIDQKSGIPLDTNRSIDFPTPACLKFPN